MIVLVYAIVTDTFHDRNDAFEVLFFSFVEPGKVNTPVANLFINFCSMAFFAFRTLFHNRVTELRSEHHEGFVTWGDKGLHVRSGDFPIVIHKELPAGHGQGYPLFLFEHSLHVTTVATYDVADMAGGTTQLFPMNGV